MHIKYGISDFQGGYNRMINRNYDIGKYQLVAVL